jgi:hypothetical protein
VVVGFFERRRFKKEVMARVDAMLLFYPGGVRQVRKNYPGIPGAIAGHCVSGDINAAHSAILVASSVITNEFEHLPPRDRSVVHQQLKGLDFAKFKEGLRGNMTPPDGLSRGASLAASALMMADLWLRQQEVAEDDFKNFASEIFGALEGKSFQQRSSERIRDTLDETLGPPPLLDGDGDTSALIPSQRRSANEPRWSATECKVRIVPTATGFALVRLDNRMEITERRSLTQSDLEKVSQEDWENGRYVNLRTRGGEIVSCLIVGENSEIVGSHRAFWWALAEVTARMLDVRVSSLRMSVHALAHVHAEARAMWNSVIKQSGSIEQLREEPMYARNIHLEVISRMIEGEKSAAGKLGLEICKAMVLCVQSEDDVLEAFAYERFKRFLWRPGEEPNEFYGHDTANLVR